MAEKLQLLTDEQMQGFIRDGYLLVQADFPGPIHRDICQRIETVFEKEKNPGNNILPRIPQVQRVFDHPVAQGALRSILGPNFLMNPHRHCHLNPPGSKGQNWHKDNYVFDQIMRHPRPRWVFAFYYPQEVTPEMGPTGLLPGRHYHHHISSDNPAQTVETELPLCGPAGTVAIVHYDSWHRAIANRSDRKRYMLKFLFERLEEPQAPSWNCADPQWHAVDSEPLERVSADVWHWLRGKQGALPETAGIPGPVKASTLVERMAEDDETARLQAAYALAALGEPAIPPLLRALQEQAVAAAEHLAEKMPGNPRGSNPPACLAGHALAAIGLPAVLPLIEVLRCDHWCARTMAADTLGNIGLPAQGAAPALTALLQDSHPRVRRHAAEALGRMGAAAGVAVPALIDHIRDPDVHVRHNAVLALAKIGQPANEAIPPLLETLEDEDRYVRYFAAVALRRLSTPEAHQALMEALFTARWCPVTNAENMY